MSKPHLSIILPQYNELANLQKGVLEEIHNYLKDVNFSYEVIIIDDGSTDKSYEFSKNIISQYSHFQFFRIDHAGKAQAINAGIKHVNGIWTLVVDMDLSTPISEVEKLLPFQNDYSVIIGSRGMRRSQSSFLRKIASMIFSTFRRILILRKISDTQCGFKLFRSDVLQKIFPLLDSLKERNVKGWHVSAFDVELLYFASVLNYKIKEVEVKWDALDASTTKQRKFVSESIDMIRQILRIYLKRLQGKYKID